MLSCVHEDVDIRMMVATETELVECSWTKLVSLNVALVVSSLEMFVSCMVSK